MKPFNPEKSTSPRRIQRSRKFLMGLHIVYHSPARWVVFPE